MSNVVSEYKKLPLASKAGICFVLTNIIQNGISFLATPIFTRLLSVSEYGYYSVFFSWNNLLLVVATLSLFNSVMNNGLLKYEDDMDGFVSGIQGLSGVSVLIWIILVFFLQGPFTKLAGLDIGVLEGLLASLLFYPSFLYWTVYQKYMFNYVRVLVTGIAFSVLKFLMCLLFIHVLTDKNKAMVYGVLAVQFVFGIVFFIINTLKGKKLINIEYWRYTAGFNIPLLPHYLSGIVLGQADRIMINSIIGASAAGLYSLAYNLSVIMNAFITGMMGAFMPWLYRKIKKADYEGVGKCINTLCVIVGGVGIMCILAAPEIIRFLGTSDYSETVNVVPPVVAGSFFFFLYNCFASFEFYYEKKWGIMIASVTAAAANVALNYWTIPSFGYSAAAYTTLFSYGLLAVFHGGMYWNIARKRGMNNVLDFRFISAVSIFIVVISLMGYVLYDFLGVRIIVIFTLLVLALALSKQLRGFVSTLRE